MAEREDEEEVAVDPKLRAQLQEVGARLGEWAKPIAAFFQRPDIQEGFRQANRMKRGRADDQPEDIRRAYQALYEQKLSIPAALDILPVLPEPHKKAGRPSGPSVKAHGPLITEMIQRVEAGEKRAVVLAEMVDRVGGETVKTREVAHDRLLAAYLWERRKRNAARRV